MARESTSKPLHADEIAGRMLESIVAVEEEHADDLVRLLEELGR